jgi:hypothetical protein
MTAQQTLPRRRLLAAVLALPVAALPAVAMAATAPADADAELISICRSWQSTRAELHRVDDITTQTRARVDALTPPLPEVLRRRVGDRHGWQLPGSFHDFGSVEEWRNGLASLTTLHPGPYRVRAEEIITAWDAHQAVRYQLLDACGVYALDDKADCLVGRLDRLEDQIFERKATTVAGLAIKAEILSQFMSAEQPDTFEESLTVNLIRDVLEIRDLG